MQGLRFKKEDGSPDLEERDAVLKQLFEAEPVGIFTLPAGKATIRFSPPFIISKEEISYLDEIMDKILSTKK